jgi:hypothetical protein
VGVMGIQNQDKNEKSRVKSHLTLIKKISAIVVFLAALATIITLFIGWKQSENARRNAEAEEKNAATVLAIAIEQRNLQATIAGAGNISLAQQATLIMLNEQQAKLAPNLATVPIPTIVTPSPTQIPTPTYTPSPTITLTDTPIPPTPTERPTATPVIVLPFKDDFSNGIIPPWTIVSGKWVVGSNGATITVKDGDNFTGVIMIDYPALTNYQLRVNVHTPNASIFDIFGEWGVVVRYRSDHDQNIVFYTNDLAESRWGYVPSLIMFPSNVLPIDDVSKRDYYSDYTLELEVSGNTFTARAFGVKYDQIIITGYESGGIALVTKCGSVGSCPSFSNFSLEPLP